jgi:hypothetical protein
VSGKSNYEFKNTTMGGLSRVVFAVPQVEATVLPTAGSDPASPPTPITLPELRARHREARRDMRAARNPVERAFAEALAASYLLQIAALTAAPVFRHPAPLATRWRARA